MRSRIRSDAVRTYLPWVLVAAVAVTALLTAFLNPSIANSSPTSAGTAAKNKNRQSVRMGQCRLFKTSRQAGGQRGESRRER